MGGRSSSSGKSSSKQMTSSEFANELEMYVGGGYGSPSEAMSKKALDYLENHMKTTDKILYRVEDSKYTADKLKKGQIFQFNGNYRGFSSRRSFVNESIEEEGLGGNKPAVFVMLGKKNSLEVNKHYRNSYFGDQQEHIAGGKYKVVNTEVSDGKKYVYIRQQ